MNQDLFARLSRRHSALNIHKHYNKESPGVLSQDPGLFSFNFPLYP